MVVRQTDAYKTTAHIHKYVLIYKRYFHEGGIKKLLRANNLWNNLLAIHKKGQKDFKEARHSVLNGYVLVFEKVYN